MFIFRNLDQQNCSLNRTRVAIPRKIIGFLAKICLIWNLMEYANDHNPDA